MCFVVGGIDRAILSITSLSVFIADHLPILS
jgi:hypothetical protein